jgi:hypothetical protein
MIDADKINAVIMEKLIIFSQVLYPGFGFSSENKKNHMKTSGINHAGKTCNHQVFRQNLMHL